MALILGVGDMQNAPEIYKAALHYIFHNMLR